VYNIIGSFFGSVDNLPFTKRSLRNLCGQISREEADYDVRKTVEVFDQIGAKDPDSVFRVQADSETRIKIEEELEWRDEVIDEACDHLLLRSQTKQGFLTGFLSACKIR
jgi:hypothetical protein